MQNHRGPAPRVTSSGLNHAPRYAGESLLITRVAVSRARSIDTALPTISQNGTLAVIAPKQEPKDAHALNEFVPRAANLSILRSFDPVECEANRIFSRFDING